MAGFPDCILSNNKLRDVFHVEDYPIPLLQSHLLKSGCQIIRPPVNLSINFRYTFFMLFRLIITTMPFDCQDFSRWGESWKEEAKERG